jgi:hypothetical protein
VKHSIPCLHSSVKRPIANLLSGVKNSIRHKVRSLVLPIAMFAASLVFAACGSSKPPLPPTARLIGTWEQMRDPDPTKGLMPLPKMTFGEDGSLLMELPKKDNPVRDQFTWKLDGEKDGLMTLSITHEPDGRHETMAVRLSGDDELKVEGKSPATFRRKY